MTPVAIKEWIRARALDLGFERVGFTSTAPLEHGDALLSWLLEGRAGTMGYLAREPERRARPESLLPGAKTVVCVLARYQASPPGERAIAAYAVRPDYHVVMRERLDQLGRAIVARWPDERYRPCVDTAPLLERELHARAGVGWVGKSTMLIHETIGCHTLLGELLLSTDLPPDAPAKDRCGTCVRCLEACPTNAFPVPYVLDATRCLSYSTIEHRGETAEALRAAQGTRAFGCDECLTACPFGQRTRDEESGILPTDAAMLEMPLPELHRRARDHYKKSFGHTPVLRASKRGLLRNTIVALGNARSEAALPLLAEALAGEDLLLRAHAAWALGRIGGEKALALLASARETERDADVGTAIERALGSAREGAGPLPERRSE